MRLQCGRLPHVLCGTRLSCRRRLAAAWLVAVCAGVPPVVAQTPPQTSADGYTRYELQAAGTGAFRIVYDITATTPRARRYYNTIRAGARETVHGVTDAHTGSALRWRVVDGAAARGRAPAGESRRALHRGRAAARGAARRRCPRSHR